MSFSKLAMSLMQFNLYVQNYKKSVLFLCVLYIQYVFTSDCVKYESIMGGETE